MYVHCYIYPWTIVKWQRSCRQSRKNHEFLSRSMTSNIATAEGHKLTLRGSQQNRQRSKDDDEDDEVSAGCADGALCAYSISRFRCREAINSPSPHCAEVSRQQRHYNRVSRQDRKLTSVCRSYLYLEMNVMRTSFCFKLMQTFMFNTVVYVQYKNINEKNVDCFTKSNFYQ